MRKVLFCSIRFLLVIIIVSFSSYKVNADGPHYLAMVARDVGAKLVHISTDYVFDGTKKEPYTESDKPNPLQVYGKSKLKGEHLIKETGVSGFIIRTSWVYGNYGKKAGLRKTGNKAKEDFDPFVDVVYDCNLKDCQDCSKVFSFLNFTLF